MTAPADANVGTLSRKSELAAVKFSISTVKAMTASLEQQDAIGYITTRIGEIEAATENANGRKNGGLSRVDVSLLHSLIVSLHSIRSSSTSYGAPHAEHLHNAVLGVLANDLYEIMQSMDEGVSENEEGEP
jgi:hypothetical protein